MSEVLLKIRPQPIPDDDKGPKRGPILMEQAIAALHGLRKQGGHVSFSIAFHEGKVCFFARTEERFASFLEGQIYAQYPECDIERLKPHVLDPKKREITCTATLKLASPEIFPIKRYQQFDDLINRINVDPLSGITATIAQFHHPDMRGGIEIQFHPLSNRFRKRALRFLPLLNQGFARKWEWYRNLFTRLHLARGWRRPLFFLPDLLLGGFRSWFRSIEDIMSLLPEGMEGSREELEREVRVSGSRHDREDELQAAKDKVNRLLYETTITLSVTAYPEHLRDAKAKLEEILGSMKQFDLPMSNHFAVRSRNTLTGQEKGEESRSFLLSAEEIATIWHLPTVLVKTPSIDWVQYRKLEPPGNLPVPGKENDPALNRSAATALSTDPATGSGLTILGEAFFRGRRARFGIRPDDRRRHIYLIGKTGMGKSTLLENMIFSDIQAGKGVAVIDPHGDLADAVLRMVPRERTNDVVLFDPADRDYPVSFNMLEGGSPGQQPLIASGLMAVFTKLWPDVWSGRMEHILRNTLLALIESPGNSLLGVMRMYADASFRAKIVEHLSDPLVRSFWEDEFASWTEKFRTEAVSAIQNKVGQLLSTPIIRNIVGQVRSTIDLRHSMDTGKIVIVNLSKGKLGEDNANFLGSMLVTKFQLDAMSRAELPESERRDFYLYVDEFQNFATPSFATILSEARKYRLNLTMANQFVGQLTPDKGNTMLKDAVFGNVGTLISFQVGSEDAEEIANQFGDETLKEDIGSLPKYAAYLRLMIDGVTSRAFSVATLPPPHVAQTDFTPSPSAALGTGSVEGEGEPLFQVDEKRVEVIRKLSRERYSAKRADVEANIMRWAASQKVEKTKQRNEEKAKEKEAEEREKAKKKGMKLEEYRLWRDREMWTNRINQLKKIVTNGGALSQEEMAEMQDLEKKLAAAGGATVPARTDPFGPGGPPTQKKSGTGL